jgi:hypothetical protein
VQSPSPASQESLKTLYFRNFFALNSKALLGFLWRASLRRTQRGCAATEIETEIITTKVAKSTKEEIEM